MSMMPNLEPAELPADAVEVGRILDAWGIKGWFKVLPYSASPEALFSSKRWYLLPSEKGGASFTGGLKLPIREAKEHSDAVVASSGDVPDRNAAEALKGARIFIPRSSFPTADPDEYYWVDLIGMTVVNRASEVLGVVHDLMSTGPQTVLVVHAPSTLPGAKPQEVLIPFVSAYVDGVDLGVKRISVDWSADYN